MSTNTTNPAQLVGLIYDDLAAWVLANGGEIHLTRSPFDLVELLADEPGSWRLTLHWEGDAPADDRVRECAVLRNRFRIVVDGNLGMTATPLIALIKATASRSPFLAVLDLVRQRVMAYRFAWLREPNNRPWYKGTDDKLPMPDGVFVAAYNQSYELLSTMALPATPIELNLPDPDEE